MAESAPMARTHVVSAGENLLQIAQRYQVTLASLRQANNLDSDMIRIGQSLRIPGTSLAVQP